MRSRSELVFLDILKNSIHPENTEIDQLEELTDEDISHLFYLAKIHNVTSLVYDTIGRTEFFLNIDTALTGSFKKNAINQMLVQTVRTENFFDIYKQLCDQGFDPAIVKGLAVRRLYPKPDLRPSSDEDLLISPDHFHEVDEYLKENGYQRINNQDEDIPHEAGYRNVLRGMYLEIHTSLFSDDNESGAAYNSLLTNAYANRVQEEYEGHYFYTLTPEDHLLYLIAHAAKHFMHSGVGIRQVCDIALFTENYKDLIDLKELKTRLNQVNLLPLANAFYAIAVKYLGLDRTLVQNVFAVDIDNTDDILNDILEGGVYGQSKQERLHSATITTSENTAKGIKHALFPGYEYMASRYPYIKKHPYLKPAAYVQRIYQYAKDNRRELLKPLSKGITRSKLVHRYLDQEIQTEDMKEISTYSYMAVIREGLAEGKEMPVPVVGNSMVPFLVNNRDTVLVHPLDRDLKPGDIVLYQRLNGRYVLHRIISIKDSMYMIAGDNEDVIEKNIQKEQIFGYVSKIRRKGQWIDETDRTWQFFANVWSKIVPAHRTLISFYTTFNRFR